MSKKLSVHATVLFLFAYLSISIVTYQLPTWAWLIGWASSLMAIFVVPYKLEKMEKKGYV